MVRLTMCQSLVRSKRQSEAAETFEKLKKERRSTLNVRQVIHNERPKTFRKYVVSAERRMRDGKSSFTGLSSVYVVSAERRMGDGKSSFTGLSSV